MSKRGRSKAEQGETASKNAKLQDQFDERSLQGDSQVIPDPKPDDLDPFAVQVSMQEGLEASQGRSDSEKSDVESFLNLLEKLNNLQRESDSYQLKSNDDKVQLFHNAIASGDHSSVLRMLRENPDIIRIRCDGKTALFKAVEEHKPKIVRALLEAKADVTQRSGVQHDTVLHAAVEMGYEDITASLIPECTSILNEQNILGQTPLHAAVIQSSYNCGNILLENRSDPNIKDNYGNTPLQAGIKLRGDVDFLLGAANLDVTSHNMDGFNAIHQAVVYNRLRTAGLLLDRFPSLISSRCLEFQDTTLHIAAEQNFAQMLEVLLKYPGVAINALNSARETPLHCAAEAGATECVELLLSHGADIDAKTGFSDTPLHYAARINGNGVSVSCTQTLTELIDTYKTRGVESEYDAFLVLLVKHGGKIDAKDINGETPLDNIKREELKNILWELQGGQSLLDDSHVFQHPNPDDEVQVFHNAIASADHSCVFRMLRENPDIIRVKYEEQTALFKAVVENEPKIVKALVKAKADVTQRSGVQQQTVLHAATKLKFEDIITFLIPECTSILNEQDINGRTPLHVAVMGGSTNCGKILLENRSDPNIQNNFGDTPLQAGIECGKDVDFLIGAPNLDVTSRSMSGFNAIHLAVRENRLRTARLLLDRFPSLISTRSRHHLQTPLHLASTKNLDQMLDVLLNRPGVDVNALHSVIETPLHCAAEAGATECVELLLSHGADIDAKTGYGETPLHMAAKIDPNEVSVSCTQTLTELINTYDKRGVESEFDAFLVLLVKKGGKVDVEDVYGETPLDYIKKEELKNILQELQSEQC